ncbi:hypothetical protein DSM104443_00599 [Usitatibacter rugosus]|uniref:Uncharacterized protein n=1 Tax=Usitatibacter rugosus TaxID=2732067 RepID=A0A6M4GQC9_9PROT|nr:hypothetical protein [Usitatibacter rugosus]QJR09550.1 hypothetical protein DSM104443_00599 [Usitatibacter rugosus]
MTCLRIVVFTVLLVGPVPAIQVAQAQVPAHTPGTICFTPRFWCWANPPGPPGRVCYCPSQYGWVQGTLN